MKTKKNKEYSFQHTKARLKERYGLELYKDEYNTICQNTKIMQGVLELMGEKKQKIVTVHFKGKRVKFVYGIGCDYVTTALPPK
jgi:ATP-dependent Clp protease adapter protein ClpS